MLVLLAKAVILGILMYGAKQYYFEQPKSSNQPSQHNAVLTPPVTTRVPYERLSPRRTTTTTTKKPYFYTQNKPCGQSQLCVPHQLCNITATKVDGFNIDYSDTDMECGYLNVCCNETDVIKLTPNEKPREPLIYKNCSFAADYSHKHKAENENSTQIELIPLPWIVNVMQRENYRGAKDTFVCAGSLIAADIVLTAASCFIVALDFFGAFYVRAGEFGSNTKPVKMQERRVSRKINYGNEYQSMFSNDVLLLVLESPFDLNFDLQPVCLPPKDSVIDYENCLIAGFPRGKYDSTIMRRVTDYNLEKRQRFTLKPMLAEQHCQPKVFSMFTHDKNNKLDPSLICIDKEIDNKTCYADTGSAIVCARRGSLDFYQVAITRHNTRCDGFRMPGIETSVKHFRPWIEESLAELKIALP